MAVRSVVPLWWHALLSLRMVVLMSIISGVGVIPLRWGGLTSVVTEFVMGWMPSSVRGGGILFTAILHVVCGMAWIRMMVAFVLVGGMAAKIFVVPLWWLALLTLSKVVLMSIIWVVGMIPSGWGRVTSFVFVFVVGWMPPSVRGGGILFTVILHVVCGTAWIRMVAFVLAGGKAARRSIVTFFGRRTVSSGGKA